MHIIENFNSDVGSIVVVIPHSTFFIFKRFFLVFFFCFIANDSETKILVTPDSSVSMAEEIELDDTDMICSTSPEPEMCYGMYKIIFLNILINDLFKS